MAHIESRSRVRIRRRAPQRKRGDNAMPAGPATIVFTGGGSVNSRALQIAGITDDTPDPPGGRIQRDVDGAGRGAMAGPRPGRPNRSRRWLNVEPRCSTGESVPTRSRSWLTASPRTRPPQCWRLPGRVRLRHAQRGGQLRRPGSVARLRRRTGYARVPGAFPCARRPRRPGGP